MDKFNSIFSEYRNEKDKFESQYTVVIYDYAVEKLLEKVKHQINLANTSRDKVKRTYLNDKLYGFRKFIENKKADVILNCVFLVGKDGKIEEITLEKPWLAVLKDFGVDNFIFKHGEYFEIDYLEELFLDTTYKHVLHVNNNKLTHYYMNKTKKKIAYSEESKSLNIEEYIAINIPEKCIVHGVSGLLKNIKLGSHILSAKNLRDEEIFEIFEKEQMLENHKKLDEWLENISNPKMNHRLVFGKNKDIKEKIENGELGTLFCTYETLQYMKTIIPRESFNFDVYVIKTFRENDAGFKLKTSYDGALGITYY
jgi:hypothetical protein